MAVAGGAVPVAGFPDLGCGQRVEDPHVPGRGEPLVTDLAQHRSAPLELWCGCGSATCTPAMSSAALSRCRAIGSGCFLAGFGESQSLVAEVGDELQGRGDPEAQVRQVLNPEFLVEIEALAAT